MEGLEKVKKADKRVKEYLERANRIRAAFNPLVTPLTDRDSVLLKRDVEIAKMIQLEEKK